MANNLTPDELEVLKLSAMVRGASNEINQRIINPTQSLMPRSIDPVGIINQTRRSGGLASTGEGDPQRVDQVVQHGSTGDPNPNVVQVTPTAVPGTNIPVAVPTVITPQQVGRVEVSSIPHAVVQQLVTLLNQVIVQQNELKEEIKTLKSLNETFILAIEKQLQNKIKDIKIRLND